MRPGNQSQNNQIHNNFHLLGQFDEPAIGDLDRHNLSSLYNKFGLFLFVSGSILFSIPMVADFSSNISTSLFISGACIAAVVAPIYCFIGIESNSNANQRNRFNQSENTRVQDLEMGLENQNQTHAISNAHQQIINNRFPNLSNNSLSVSDENICLGIKELFRSIRRDQNTPIHKIESDKFSLIYFDTTNIAVTIINVENKTLPKGHAEREKEYQITQNNVSEMTYGLLDSDDMNPTKMRNLVLATLYPQHFESLLGQTLTQEEVKNDSQEVKENGSAIFLRGHQRLVEERQEEKARS